MNFVQQWSEDEWLRARLVVNAKVVEALVHKGRAEIFGALCKHDPKSAALLDNVRALSNQAVRIAENFEIDKRIALFELSYDCSSEDKRDALFRLEDEYEMKCQEAKAIASEEIASRRQSGEMLEWGTVELAQEWQQIYERLLAPDKKFYEAQVSSLGLSRRAAGNDGPSFWDELKTRCRETIIGPPKPKEHPHVVKMTQIVNEIADLANQIKEVHMARRQTDGCPNAPTL